MTFPAPPAPPLPIRLRDRILVPPAPRDTSLITGHRARTPQRIMVQIADPLSGASTPMAVWHYAPAQPAGGARSSAPLVMVHGFRGDHHGLALIADCLPDQELYLPELPGFGHSPAFPAAEHSVQNYADAVRQAMARLGVIPDDVTHPAQGRGPTLVGHSFGSVVASHLAAENPSVWERLALLNPICEPALSADGSVVERALARVAQGYYELAAALPERLGMAVLGSPAVVWATGTVMSKTEDRRVLAYLHDQHQQYFSAFDTRRVLVESYRASISGTVLEVADQLALPVLMVAGAEDELGSVAGQERLAELIREVSPAVRLEVLADVGHLVHYERAPRTAALLQEFVASGPADA